MNVPAQVCTVCDTTGHLTVMWFRFKDENEEIHMIKVDTTHETGVPASSSRVFECSAIIDNFQQVYKLLYEKDKGTWKLIGRKQ